jgi:NitT/TauT family transport system ATP-binding protein
VIRIDGVSKSFAAAGRRGGEIHALDRVELEVGERELVTLVGRSGCGKSTLLRIVAGLIAPSTGRVLVGGREVRGPSRDVALAFQRPALLPWRNVLENVLLPIDVLGLDRGTYRRRAEELLGVVGLAGFEDRRPHELSGGMQQRAALCRSLVYDPSVLLMDEPFAALDALTREELSLELQRLFTEHGKTIVFVTHSISEAVLLADRIVVMTPRPGRIAEIVPVEAARPRSLWMAGQAALAEASARVHDLLFAPDAAAAA